MTKRIKDVIQDANLNFLIGSGLSAPYLKVLGNIELLLSHLEEKELDNNRRKVIKASLYKKYFDEVIAKNTKILESDVDAKETACNYFNFLKAINFILLKRKSSILSKEANIFTTNIDIFLEKTMEDLNVEFNDGFNGRFNPRFSLSNFKITHRKKSLHYDNVADLPTFNLLKIHGSLTWKTGESCEKISFSSDLKQVRNIQGKQITPSALLEINDSTTIENLISGSEGKVPDSSINSFLEEYEKLLIVNPTKEKFKHTIMNQTHYELLRIYANELEKENTVLFVMGFSFADEHIKEITLRAVDSNPTLIVYVVAYNSKSRIELENKFDINNRKNDNIIIMSPPQELDGSESPQKKDKFEYGLSNINFEIFGKLFEKETDRQQDEINANQP